MKNGEILVPKLVPDKDSTSGEKIVMVPWTPSVGKYCGITYPPEILPEAEDPETAIVVIYPDGIPFQ